jgi:hypothetical protein
MAHQRLVSESQSGDEGGSVSDERQNQLEGGEERENQLEGGEEPDVEGHWQDEGEERANQLEGGEDRGNQLEGGE